MIHKPLRARTISNGTLIQCGDLVLPQTIAKVFAHDPNGDAKIDDAIIAAEIVQAVNTHDELVRACRYALAIAEDKHPGTWDDVMIEMRRVLAAEA